jgi:cellulose synthase operon protein YhjQ
MAQIIGSPVSLQADPKDAENRSKNSSRTREIFDPLLCEWVRAQESALEPEPEPEPEAAPDPDPIAAPASIASDRPQPKPSRDNGSLFKWTSWFRTGTEEERVLITPPPQKENEPAAALPSAPIASQEPAETPMPAPDQDTFAPAPQIAAVDHTPSAPEPSPEISHDLPVPDAPIASVETTSDPAPSSAPASEFAAPGQHTAASIENNFTPAPSPAAELNSGELMWESVLNEEEIVSKPAPSSPEIHHEVRDADSSRWFVLKGMMGGAPALQPAFSEPAGNVPVLEIFSLAGGVGKTSLVATLGRALSARGEGVLLVEATPLPSMQYFFGACDSRPGVVRTFRPPASSTDAPIRLASADPEALFMDSTGHGSLASDVQHWAAGANRVIVDVATGSTATVRGLAKMSPAILVPLVPDVNSVVAATSIDSFFHRQAAASGSQPNVFYVLNQFDASLPLHLDVRKVLRERLGDRLLPFALERTPAISEALAEGMTIMDYAPDSRAAANFTSLAKWLEQALAPATTNSHGRWSER